MKRIVYIIVVFLSLNSLGQERLSFVSYNVRNGSGMDDVRDFSRASNVINSLGADVVSLQEIDSVTKRSLGVDVIKAYGDLTGMESFFSKAIDYGGGGYGVGMLSKTKPLKVQRYALPGREELRTLLLAEYEGFVFCATHFSLTAEDQLLSIGIIDSLAKVSEKPFFVAGDFNFAPNSEQFRRLSKSFKVLTSTKNGTYPADAPVECIDYIVWHKNSNFAVKNINSSVVEAPIESDHRPVYLELEIIKK